MPSISTNSDRHGAGDWTLSEAAGATLWWLRGDQIAAELRVNETAETPHGTLLCVEPDAWLAVSASPDGGVHLPPGPATEPVYALDVTGAYRVLQLEGPGATRLLAQGCALDFGMAAFPVGRCARTRVAEVPVILHRSGETAFTLYCPRSYGEYLREVLSNGFRPPDR